MYWGGWKFSEQKGAPPAEGTKGVTWHERTGVVLRPPFSKHTTHFTEASLFLVHAHRYPHLYPWLRAPTDAATPTFSNNTNPRPNTRGLEIYLPRIRTSDYAWSRDYIKALRFAVHDEPDSVPIVFRRSGLRRQRWCLCDNINFPC
jgi:hypothetical protein